MLRTMLFATAILASAPAIAASPAHFLKDAIQGDYSEAVLGRYIRAHGGTAQVRNFGAMLNRDHSNGLIQAKAGARREHLSIPSAMKPEASAELRKLRHLSGARFDREVRRYMIDDHREDIAKFREQARSGDRATAAFARATVPVLHRHLAMAEAIRR
jgi:putative membrane protein